MTVTITVTVGESHKNPVRAQKEVWVPQSDDGATFLPGRWEKQAGEIELEGGVAHQFVLDGKLESVKVWELEAPAEAESEA